MKINTDHAKLSDALELTVLKISTLTREISDLFDKYDSLSKVLNAIENEKSYNSRERVYCLFLMGWMYRNIVAQHQMAAQVKKNNEKKLDKIEENVSGLILPFSK